MTHHDHEHHHDDAADPAEMIELLDLDGEVLGAYLHDVTAWVHGLAPARTRRVLDLGCGTGNATFAFAPLFPDAELIALDTSSESLARVREKASERQAEGRVRILQADLDAAWPGVDGLDVVWASLSLHHLADPAHALKEVFAAVNPGGLVAVAEMTDQIRFLPDDVGLGRPGLEERINAVLDELHAEQVPNLGLDWRALLERAGFAVEAEREFVIDLSSPLPPAAGRFAHIWFRRVRTRLDGKLAEDDLFTLYTLIAGHGRHSLVHRDDLHLRGRRTVYLARRP